MIAASDPAWVGVRSIGRHSGSGDDVLARLVPVEEDWPGWGG